MYKSEAQAFQAIRRDWKRKRNEAQRAQTMYQWQIEHEEVHPYIRKFIASVMNRDWRRVHMPLDSMAKIEMRREQREAGKYQYLLNRYKIEHN